MLKNKKIFILLIALFIVGSLTFTVGAQDSDGDAELNYPTRPVDIIVPFGQGGASDVFVRKFSSIMSKNMPEPVQTVNRSGSGGFVGMMNAYQQDNDGYTILSITPSHVIADVLERSETVKLMEDFEPLVRIQSDIYVLSVPKESRFESFEEIVEYGQENTVTFAGVSPGGLDDMTLNALARETGMDIKFIPYPSGSEVKAAVLGGEVDIYLDKIISAINYIKEGDVKPVVVLNEERIDQIPELASVPTTVELGYDMTIGSWRGFVVKKGTPQAIKDYLIDQMNKAYNTDEYQNFAAQNLVNIREGFLTPDEFRQLWKDQYEVFDKIAKDVGLK